MEEGRGRLKSEHTQGLVYPVRYADGEHFHLDAQQTLIRKDFSELNYPDDVFRASAKYLEFDDRVRSMASDLTRRLEAVPAWQNDFPVIEPAPLPPISLERTVI